MNNPLATATPLLSNPLRKQTLLGMMAPVIPPRSQPPVAAPSSPPAATTASPSSAPAALATPAPRADNPLRKQTLLGMAPVLPPAPATAAAPAPATNGAAAPAVAVEAESSVPSIAAAVAGAASDAPVTRSATRSSTPPPLPRVAERISETELPPLRTRRPRWVAPLGVAAAIGLGVVGLRQLDHAAVPGSLPPAPAGEAPKAAALLAPAKTPEVAPPVPASAKPLEDDDTDSKPPTTMPTEPEPLQAKPAEAAPAPSAATAAGAVAVRVDSDPPGARMFWRGKEVGTTPFTLELQPGEKHSYELGLPGYVTRKVVIDGTKSEISIGMKPESGAPTGASPRK